MAATERTIFHSPSSRQRRRFLLLPLFSLLAITLLGSCTPPEGNGNSENPDGKLNVAATSTPIADLSDRVGSDEINLIGILQPGADPHVYEPVPQDSVALEEADVIFYNGYNLEPNLIRIVESLGDKARKVPVGEAAEPLAWEYEGQKAPDPHVWGDVRNAIRMVEIIRDTLIEADPDAAATYRDNAAGAIAELERLHAWIEAQIATIPPEKRKLVTTHDAFQYYATAYGLEVAGTLIGISTEEQPSAQTVRKLVEAVKTAGVPTIFAETTINPELIRTVAEEAGVALSDRELYSDSIGAIGSEGDSYVKMMVSNTKAIVEGLGGSYTPFEN